LRRDFDDQFVGKLPSETIWAGAGAVATPFFSWQWEPGFFRLMTRTKNLAASHASSLRVS
jgi:hypothetical protein